MLLVSTIIYAPKRVLPTPGLTCDSNVPGFIAPAFSAAACLGLENVADACVRLRPFAAFAGCIIGGAGGGGGGGLYPPPPPHIL